MPDPQDFELQAYQGREKPSEAPRLLEEALDETYPGPSADPGAAEAADGVTRRKKRNTARLVWDSKPKKAPNPRNLAFQIAEVVLPNPGERGPLLPLEPGTQEVDTSNCNRLIWGDNLLVMQALLAQGYEGKINLIYIDPPFDSKADYSHSVQLTPDESGKGGGELTSEMSALERLAYRDTWEDGSDSYLDMLLPRLHFAKRLLSERGSLFVHSDWHMNSLIRLLLDEVFGFGGHINEIAWCYSIGGKGESRFARKHDTIYLYSHNENIQFDGRGRNVVKPRKLNSHMRLKVDETGREYQEKTDTKTGKIYKYYVDDGKIPEDYWTDIEQLNWEDRERVGYDTQKPEKLIARIIESTTSPGDLVADFFCGSGTTAAVAEKLGRRWIASDLGKAALQVTRNRLVRLGTAGSGGIAFQRSDGRMRCSPFVVENLGNYQRQLLYLSDTRLRQVGPLVLTLFGATPHPSERNLGTQAFNDPETGRFQRRLVLVGDPDRPLSARRVAEAVKLLNTLDGGGYTKLVALGWDFELNFDSALEKALGTEGHARVEARVVPTDIIEHLKKIPEGAGPEDREVERLRGKVAFFEKPWLGVPSIQSHGWVEREDQRMLRVTVRLTRYLLRSVPAGLKGFEKLSEAEKREWLRLAGGADGLSLIDFWSLDEDLGGEDGKRPFTSTWQDLRGLGKRVRRVVTETEIYYAPRPGRKLGLRLVDVFGNDAAWSGLLPES